MTFRLDKPDAEFIRKKTTRVRTQAKVIKILIALAGKEIK